MASETDATSTSRKPCIKGSPAGWAINQHTATAAAKPAIDNSRFMGVSFPANPADQLPRRRQHVEIVREAPLRFLSGLDLHIDVFFRADRSADRPEIDLPQRAISADVHSGAGFAVLHRSE